MGRKLLASRVVHDIAVFGATGFVGRLVAGYLAEHAPPDATVALAGRSPEKLERLQAELDKPGWPLVIADKDDPASLTKLARDARVVATTVGPYRDGGLALVDACIAEGAHYCDLTGEVLFVHASLSRHERAQAASVRIVHSCGFDSIPSDLGVLLLHAETGDLGPTELVVAALRGGFSGGTLASMKGQIDEATADRQARKIVFDPYALGGDGPRERDLRKVTRNPKHGWIGPFVMATYNTRVVRRSHALLNYGSGFRYREIARYPNPLMAAGTTAALGALAAGLAFKPARALLDKVLPGPGDGPSEQSRRNGHFRMEVHGNGHVATVAAKGDPGYAATAVMMGETALSLALDALPSHTGVLTPATALGMPLIERLRAAGMTFEVAVNDS
jgi:short subunit dehydrogenase-like uncharacterized protein